MVWHVVMRGDLADGDIGSMSMEGGGCWVTTERDNQGAELVLVLDRLQAWSV